MIALDHKLNYYALMITMLNPNYSPEAALEAMNGKPPMRQPVKDNRPTAARPPRLDGNVLQDMLEYRQEGLKFRDIAAIYGISDAAAWRRIKRYEASQRAKEVIQT